MSTARHENGPSGVQGTWSDAAQGEALWFLGTLAIIRVPGEAVQDRFSLTEILLPHHASPPLHTHPQDETYVVLEGRMAFQAGTELLTLEAGGVVTLPMGVPHSFRVDSETARVLMLSTPAGIERFVRDGAVPAGALTLPPSDAPRPDPEQIERLFSDHAVINVGPRLEPDG